jgi:ATP-dependent exoDNAse (exonuclease V) beta subunit
VRGVIDLVYRVAEGGWKIVDYKTEAVDTLHHGAQVESYARYWERISGDRVAAKGLWSTKQGYVSI